MMSAITQSDLINSLNVPKVEIDKFEGNPLDYLTFMAIFDEVVHTKVMDGQVKLTRLLQYTSGPAKMAIKNCALIGGDAGYAQARAILKNRYGNSHLVSHMIISDLKNGKRITKANELQQLADELSTALTALGQLGKCAELNTQQSIIDILQRCQPYVRNNWRKKALDCKRHNDVYPAFDEFVAFVQNVASEACDPVYGAVSTKSHDGVRGENYATVANDVSAAPNDYTAVANVSAARTTTLLSRTTFLPPRTALPDHDRIRLECQNTREDRPIGLVLCAPNRIGCTTVTLSNACDPMRDSTSQDSVSCASIVCCQITVQMRAANSRFVQCLVVVGNTQSSCMCIMIMLIRSRMLSIIAMIMIVTS